MLCLVHVKTAVLTRISIPDWAEQGSGRYSLGVGNKFADKVRIRHKLDLVMD